MAVRQQDTGYPVFRDAEGYMNRRVRRTPLGLLKTRVEERALERCLRGLTDVRAVCDMPSGPGRLFGFWQRRGFHVRGVDISEPMVRVATTAHREHGLGGSVCQGDIFGLPDDFTSSCDLAVSVRFAYYFDRPGRVTLLCLLANTSRHYVLVQYKVTETVKGRVNLLRRRKGDTVAKCWRGKYHCSYEEIVNEVGEAGLRPLRIVPISELSDRVFVVAEKLGLDSCHSSGVYECTTLNLVPRRTPFAAAVGILAGGIAARS